MTNSLELEVAEKAAREMAELIAWEVMCGLMSEVGWAHIRMPSSWMHMTAEFQYEIKEWCRNNLTGHYQCRGRSWLFATEKDAVLFSLRWS